MTVFGDTPMWHCPVTVFGDTPMWHCPVTVFGDTPMWHCPVTVFGDTPMWHCPVTVFGDTPMWHCPVTVFLVIICDIVLWWCHLVRLPCEFFYDLWHCSVTVFGDTQVWLCSLGVFLDNPLSQWEYYILTILETRPSIQRDSLVDRWHSIVALICDASWWCSNLTQICDSV